SVLRELGKQLPAHDRSIDIIVATHPDQDHIGGLPAVLERYAISYVFRSGAVHDTSVYRAFNTAIQNEDGIQEVLARRGTRIDLGGGAYFEILFPDRDVSKADPNDASIVGRLVYGEIEVMLTGDAPNSIERYLVSLDGKALGSDILKIGHHGSKTSSSNEFIGFVGPDYGIISAGCDNRYGHPHQDVLSVLAHFDIEILGTCEEGTIVFEADGATLWRR
ncbi:MAG TPA: MBL fold metallo-hydrolase, partial [Candidatus Paceibacterota bacterium]